MLVLLKVAALVVEDFLDLSEYLGKQTRLSPGKHAFVSGFVAAVEETVVFLVMSVKVTKNVDALRNSLVFHDFFEEIDFRMNSRIGI